MSLFQNSVLKKYLKSQHTEELKEKWALFKAYFHNSTIQENIRNLKEEEFQEGFVRELFVNVLGYTLNPNPNYNFVLEKKNVKDSKKADGAIVINNNVKAVIELKGTDTTDLGKVESQAFNYKNNQPECVYVVTSNFEKLRFYIENAIEHLEFNLFNLTEEEFNLLYVCLAHKNIESNVAKNIKDESVSQEDVITKKLYNDYSLFKRELYQNLVKLNPGYDQLELFKKSQKLLDRFLFIFFAEDRSLLPTNLIFRINKEWQQLREMRIEVSLYDRYKIYFNDLNHGAKVSLPAFSQTAAAKKEEYQIYAYNGGLFKDDEILNAVKIDDDVLFKHTEKLSNYDFASEVDVNILGHIFENSLNELDEIKAQLEGQAIEKTKTKRKKDGVFYTPKYITKYIVDNTVGKLCADKKAELQLNEEDYTTDKKRQQKTKQALTEKLNNYRNWLLQLTICDPACGSGAFLNQALDFLIAEHRYIDELQAKLFGDALVLSDVEGSILENNLFGVDINEESIEIAKLSLWLRTAQPNRKLNDLNSNIKCGNSLIDDVAVAGDKAFNWQQQFPQVFEKGGFDVIVGNPPYLRVQGLRDNFEKETHYYEEKFEAATGRFDIYVLFLEKSFKLIKEKGIVSFILPHKFLNSDFGNGIRKFLAAKNAVRSIVHFGSEMVFSDASAYTCIINLSKLNEVVYYKQIKPSAIIDPFEFDLINYDSLSSDKWELNSREGNLVLDKLKLNPLTVKDVFENISQGVVSVGDDIFFLKGNIIGNKFIGFSEKINQEITIEADVVKPILKGEDVKRYSPITHSFYVFYPHKLENGKTIPFEENYFKSNYPLAYNYILTFKDELIDKKIRYKTNPKAWYSLHRSREMTLFEQDKIVTPETSLGGNMSIDYSKNYHNTQVYTLEAKKSYLLDNKFLISILNSKLFWFYLQSTGAVLRGGYFRFKTKYLEPFPMPEIKGKEIQIPFINKVEMIFSLNHNLYELIKKFQKSIHRKFNVIELPKKLENWFFLTYSEFIMELAKKKIKLSLSEEAEWEEYFNTEAKKVLELKAKIDAIDKELDQMVYKLYDLSEEEIKIVEGLNG